MQGCCHCHGRFGLVSHRFLFKRFCSTKCVGIHKRNLATAVDERLSRWCSALFASLSAFHLASIAFGKGRTSDERAETRYVRMLHGPVGALRRHP